VYSGKDTNRSNSNISCAGKVILSLMENYLNEWRTLIVDNFYTGLHIAHILLDNNTHIVGTLRKYVKNCPKDVLNVKLRVDEIKGKENDKLTKVLLSVYGRIKETLDFCQQDMELKC